MNIKYNVEKPNVLTEYTKILVDFINNTENKNMLIECDNEKQRDGMKSSFISYINRFNIDNLKITQKKISDIKTSEKNILLYVEKIDG